VILIGEIRDQETAEIAVQSALTGHLVFSTLHTNDSASAITRLVDIGIEPFLLSSALKAVIAQRLVRVLCDQCREAYTPNAAALKTLGISPEEARGKMFYRPRGCPACFHTGYRGRVCIMEMLLIDDQLKTLILQTSDSNRIRSAAMEQKMISLRQDGIEKIFKGITSIEEVIRITHL
jgi:general secretion pathway protein E